jgi:osmotically inducible protein OsmC
MPIRKAQAVWEGTLGDGKGKIAFGGFEGAYSFASRFEEGPGTNPEELIGAAHAGCFSMALALELEQAGFTPKRIETGAEVSLSKSGAGFSIDSITLRTNVWAEGVDYDTLVRLMEVAKKNCPVSKALAGTQIKASAKLTEK